MANGDLCGAGYVIQGSDEEINALFDSIKKWTEAGEDPKYGNTWLGNILQGAGLSVSDFSCTGLMRYSEVIPINENESVMSIDTISEGTPCKEMWKPIVEKWAPHCKMYYFSQHPSIHEFLTNDVNGRFFPERYVLECNLAEHKNEAGPYSHVTDKLTIVSEYQMRTDICNLLGIQDTTLSNDVLLQKLAEYTEGWEHDSIQYYPICIVTEND